MQSWRHTQTLGRVMRPVPPMCRPLSRNESITQIITVDTEGSRACGRETPGGPSSKSCSSSRGMRFTNIWPTVISMSPFRIFPPQARRSLNESGPQTSGISAGGPQASGISAVGGSITSTHVPVPAGLHRSFRPSWRSMRPAALSSLIWPAAVAMLASREHNFVWVTGQKEP